MPGDELGLVAWIAFGKVGSTSLRYWLMERAKRHGWPVWPKPKCICDEPLSTVEAIQQNRRALRCATLPSGYVVQTYRLGYCALLRASHAGSRPCKYLTLLRDPLERALSAYQYYCKLCSEPSAVTCPVQGWEMTRRAEHNKQLPRDAIGVARLRPRVTCPNMSLADFASWMGNPYVEALDVMHNGTAARHPSAELHHRAVRAALKRARMALHRPDVLILLTSRLGAGEFGFLARQLGDAGLSLPFDMRRHASNSRHIASASEIMQLQTILRADIRLYHEAVTIKSVSPKKGEWHWQP
jgi:hypothetical protein